MATTETNLETKVEVYSASFSVVGVVQQVRPLVGKLDGKVWLYCYGVAVLGSVIEVQSRRDLGFGLGAVVTCSGVIEASQGRMKLVVR